jgi:hypothetical protein
LQDADGAGTFRILANDLTVHNQGHVTFRVEHDDPSAVSGEATWEHAMSRGDWSTRSTTWTRLTADADRFIVHARLQAWEGDELAHEEEWHETIPRNLV